MARLGKTVREGENQLNSAPQQLHTGPLDEL